jgi:carboxyl-terminal processing protease
MYDDEGKVGYIRLTHFSRHSADELKAALMQLKEAGMKALVLDLRFNPGGLLSQATDIADLFVEDGSIVSTKGGNAAERVWKAKKPGTFSGFPMAVLVNRYSASASEIVSACLQDHKRAVVIGERTWGKGSVQNVIELEGGASALKLTTASYHRPSGKNIHRFPDSKESDEWGVMPDDKFEVKQSLKEMQDYLEFRRERDVLKEDGPPKSEFSDRQLEKALEYLRGSLAATAAAPKTGGKKGGDDAAPVEAKRPTTGAASLLRIPLRIPRTAAA